MSESRTLQIRRLSTGSVFKLIAVGTLCSIVPFGILMGVLAQFGFKTLTWNHEQLFGVKALLMGPVIGALISGVMTLILGGLVAFGLWLYSRFRPMGLKAYEESVRSAET